MSGNLEHQLIEMLDGCVVHISTLKPSEWYEANMTMPRGSAFPGPFKFNLTPYWREPLDCAAKDHPAKEISIMKGAQLGGTAAVLNPIVGYIISQNPGNMMFLTGHSDLSDAAIVKIDQMIDNCGLRKLIKPNVLRAKNSRTGDTNKSKEFSGGDLKAGSVTNHNLLRQHDVMIMIVDDYDAAPAFSKAAGATRELVQKRTSAFAHKKKIYWVSSPQVKGTSNIEEVFMLGDQRYYNVPCPCCGAAIILKWTISIDEKENAGIFWQTDNSGILDPKSVGYICQECSGFFTDSNKYEMNLAGFWKPTAVPKELNHWSYQLSSLYAPPGMDDWAFYVGQYMAANPQDAKRNEKKHQTFLNVVMGQTYEQQGEEIQATELQKNIRDYEIDTIPEKLSIADGNGKIVTITCACDLNGKLEDARLDYEIVGWSESGASYRVTHGSIGTFIPNESGKLNKVVREHWTYENNKSNSVWPEFDKILGKIYETDTARKMKIFVTGMDTGYCELQAFTYIDTSNFYILGLKGDKEDAYINYMIDVPNFKIGQSRANLYMLKVGNIKDDLAALINLKWNKDNDQVQPAGFMNFPIPSGGKFLFENYFSHFQAESRLLDEKGNFIWKKKTSIAQNHLFDCAVYNLALKEILVSLVGKDLKIKGFTWNDYVDLLLGRRKS